MKKVIYLLLALVFPGLIFVFLRNFGKNQFDIPIYYEQGITNKSECGNIDQGQYFLPDSLLKTLEWKKGVALLTVGTNHNETKDLAQLTTSVEGARVISLDNIEASQLLKIKNCVLFLKAPWKALLMDEQKRIRGYYALNSREEMDRLEVEFKILLKKY